MMGKRKNRSRGTRDSASYEVGYQKPPKHAQFKPGQSGNPKGRPKGHRNFKTILKDVLAEKVHVREGDRTRRVSKQEALIRMTLTNALMNDNKAFASVLQLLRLAGFMDDVAEPTETENVGQDDALIVEEFLRRHGALAMQNSQQEDDSGSSQATVHLESENE
ncbi:DUF5681 domain-containing protein [Methyloceanibacter sp. wino2]|uniref:DUF5681 domain-containing protein n=1 Tax=Methyloceanibacter sp. wino2 TaxID=2170729 RepID=UPI000D3E39E1|nr:DUF5681 domain-containing protein [Methyloceanibacter sp. wino2]